MNAELIAVGTELLLGDTINTDAAAVARLLSELGINVYWQTVVGDNRARLEQAVRLARTRADLIITTGGLGPTCDDLTKEVVAGAFGIPLELNKAEEERLRGLYRERHTYMTENHLQQVMLPRGCTVLQNDWGTAPACAEPGRSRSSRYKNSSTASTHTATMTVCRSLGLCFGWSFMDIPPLSAGRMWCQA